jgi:hypothetical protein
MKLRLRPFGKLRMSLLSTANSLRSYQCVCNTLILPYRSVGLTPRGDFRNNFLFRARAPAHPPGPEKPRFWACQKVVPPPCKNVQKSAFLGEKACIFDHFVHNFAQKWPLFYGHSPPLQGCQSVGKKPANLYSTKCRIFGPRTPPACGTVVGHQFPTPSHGLPTPVLTKT